MIDTKKEHDAGNTDFEYAKMSDAEAEEVHFSHFANYEKITENDYNLSVSTYVEAENTRGKIDIVKFNAEIGEIVAREQAIRDKTAKIIAEIEVQ